LRVEDDEPAPGNERTADGCHGRGGIRDGAERHRRVGGVEGLPGDRKPFGVPADDVDRLPLRPSSALPDRRHPAARVGSDDTALVADAVAESGETVPVAAADFERALARRQVEAVERSPAERPLPFEKRQVVQRGERSRVATPSVVDRARRLVGIDSHYRPVRTGAGNRLCRVMRREMRGC